MKVFTTVSDWLNKHGFFWGGKKIMPACHDGIFKRRQVVELKVQLLIAM